MPDKVIAASLQLESEQANKKVKTFKQELKEAEDNLLSIRDKFGELSPEALNAAKRVAELRDNIKDASEVANLFDPGAKFQVLGNIVRTVAGSFSALQGTMALIGGESEEVQKSLLKVQAALAAVEGVNTIVDAAKDFERLNALIKQSTAFQKANELATKAAAFTQKLFGGAVDQTSTSFKVLKGAIAATGIGLLVVGIGEVVAALQEWAAAADKAAEEQKELAETIKNGADAQLKGEMDFINRMAKLDEEKAKAAGASEEEIYKIQRQAQVNRINSQRRYIAEIAATDELAAQEARTQLKTLNVDLEIIDLQYQEQQRKRAEEEAKKATELRKQEAEKLKQERKDAIQRQKEADEELRKLREENYLSSVKDEDKRERERLLLEAHRERERIKALRVSEETKANLIYEINRKLRADLDKLDTESDEKQKAKDAERLQRNLDMVLNNMNTVLQMNQQQLELRQELDNQTKSEFEIQLQELDKWYKDKQAIAGANEQLQTELTKSYQRQRTAIVRAEQEQQLSLVGGVLGQAAKLFAKHTAAFKILSVAEATINTYKAATAAYASMAGIPVVGPVLGAIAAGVAIAAGIKNIKEILKTNVPGGGGAGAVPTISDTATAPLAPAAQVGTTQLDQETLNNIGNATVRAFVVESDVTDNQERITRLNRAARLGD